MEKELWKGNEAIAEAAIRAGCDCFFGYPITPQSEVPEYMSAHLPKAGGVFLQSESEVAAINMVYGAAGAGMRAMTSSSSPGISLKQEGITYIAGPGHHSARPGRLLSGHPRRRQRRLPDAGPLPLQCAGGGGLRPGGI